MGAVLLMLLALVLPVAPAGAVGAVQDEGTVTAAAATATIFDDCNQSSNLNTRYFVTLLSSTGTSIPATNGGPGVATVTLIGAGSANSGATTGLTVGDLENQMFNGIDLGTVGPPATTVPNGSCSDTVDIPGAQIDGHANDYGSPYVLTSPGNAWKMLITAPGHVSRLIDLRGLVDGVTTGVLQAAFPGATGNDCLRIDRGCLISVGVITLQALTVPPAGRGSISGTVTDINGAPLGASTNTAVAILTSVVTLAPSAPGAVVPIDGRAQFTTASSHGLLVGDLVTIVGHTPPLFNTTFTVLTVDSTTTFTIVIPAGTLDLTKSPPAVPSLTSTGTGGSLIRVSGVTVSTNSTAVATSSTRLSITTNAPHNLVVGDTVTTTGFNVAAYNQTNLIVTNVDSATTFRVNTSGGLTTGVTAVGGSVFKTAVSGGVEVVLYRQPDQDPTNDATLPIPENTAFSVLTDGATGQYFVNNLWPGRYSVTVADTRLQFCNPNANCGVQPATQVINLFPGAQSPSDPNQQQQATVNFTVPVNLLAAQAPGSAIGATLAGLFGYVVDGSSGGRIGSLTPGVLGQPNNLANPVGILFTPTQPAGCASPLGLNPPGASAGCVGSVTATTDVNGRYQVLLVAGVSYVATLTGGVPGANLGLLPLGFQGACTVGGNLPTVDPTASFSGPLFQCGVGANGQDRFAIGATALAANTWNGGGSFVLVPTTVTQLGSPAGGGPVRRLEAVIPGIFRNPDTSYTGVDVETVQVRIMNNGVSRTGAQIEWYSTSSDDVASLVKTDTLDLNPGAVGIFARSVIPDGCTRCMAQIYTIDLDAPSLQNLGFPLTTTPVGFYPGNPLGSVTNGVTNGFVYGLSDLQATVTHRVVDAGNALAGGNGMTYEDIIPTGNTNNSGFLIPLVYKNYGGGVNKWNSIVMGCLSRGVPSPQPIVFQFLSAGESRGGPFQITRFTNPGGCLVLNLNTFDPNDPDYFDPLAGIPDGTYSVVVTTTAGTNIPTPPEVPGGFFASSLSYTTTGRMATLGNGTAPLAGENNVNGIRELYAPLIFKRYNDWNTGIAVAGFRPRTAFDGFNGIGGGSGAGASLAVYGEDGTLVGVFVDGISRSSAARVYYLPTLPIQLPDGFRGSMIISVGDNTAGTRTGASVQTVNYERNQAMSYNFITQDQVLGAPTPNGRPCNYPVNSTTDPESPAIGPPGGFGISPLGAITPNAYVSCLVVPDAQRRFGGAPRGSGASFEVGLGPTTGIRLFNPDSLKNGQPAYVLASYLDSAGIVFVGSYTTFSIPAYHTATIFMGSDTQLPDIYDGAMFIQATAPIAGIANVVDYRVTDRDASYSYNLPNQSGRTQ